ncbi:siphovirus ReqiPepy6 Gp37-like family protein [Streptomyces sp. NPDC000594]|uniref:siphovirus ReqiPepy6 Gp37-like family protein n=1 Tax=Streptomyces sp. NPDC000594 TaxID=3154261 RepID=UPI0033204053
MAYRVFVRGAPEQDERPILGEIDTWIKLDFTVRHNGPGTWQLLIKSGTPQEQLLGQGCGIVIYQDGVARPVFTGQIDAFERYWTTDQHTAKGSVYVGGKCDNDLLYGLLAFPGVSSADTDEMRLLPLDRQYTGMGSRPVSGPVGQVVWTEVDLAVGSRALPDRRVSGLNAGPSVPVGPAVKDTLRFDNIGEQVEEWLKDTRVGYRFVWSPATKRVELDVYECRDRSAHVRLSKELGNLRMFTWQLNAPSVTRAIVGCQGEGRDRYFWQQIDGAGERQWGVIREALVDRRDIPLRTGKDGRPELVTKTDSSTGFEDIGLGPEGKEWTVMLAATKAALGIAEKAVEVAEKALADATTQEEKAAAAAQLAQARARMADARGDVMKATLLAKPVAVAHYVEVVKEAAAHALKEGEKTGRFQIYPIDTEHIQFGRDYFVGDVVTVSADGQEYQDIVREVNISVEDGGRISSVTPKIGNQGTGEPLNLYKTVWEMKEKLRKLESRM